MANSLHANQVRSAYALLLMALANIAHAQEMSSDGAYWYEIEVTIFSSQYPERPYSEIPVPERSNLRYLPQLRLLQNPGDSYRVVFPSTEPPFPAQSQQSPAPGAASADPLAQPAAPVVVEGPQYSPAVAGSFKIADYARDPFISLDRRSWRFADINNRLQGSGEHAVLWHRVWRQPLRARAQTSSLQVQGGRELGDHYELEGSLRFSGQSRDVNIDINVWLSSFVADPAGIDGEWQLPEMPLLAPPGLPANEPPGLPTNEEPAQLPQVPANVWYPNRIWQLNQTRELGPNTLYYLDHPAMGVLVEVRPYVLPELELPLTPDQQPGDSAFE